MVSLSAGLVGRELPRDFTLEVPKQASPPKTTRIPQLACAVYEAEPPSRRPSSPLKRPPEFPEASAPAPARPAGPKTRPPPPRPRAISVPRAAPEPYVPDELWRAAPPKQRARSPPPRGVPPRRRLLGGAPFEARTLAALKARLDLLDPTLERHAKASHDSVHAALDGRPLVNREAALHDGSRVLKAVEAALAERVVLDWADMLEHGCRERGNVLREARDLARRNAELTEVAGDKTRRAGARAALEAERLEKSIRFLQERNEEADQALAKAEAALAEQDFKLDAAIGAIERIEAAEARERREAAATLLQRSARTSLLVDMRPKGRGGLLEDTPAPAPAPAPAESDASSSDTEAPAPAEAPTPAEAPRPRLSAAALRGSRRGSASGAFALSLGQLRDATGNLLVAPKEKEPESGLKFIQGRARKRVAEKKKAARLIGAFSADARTRYVVRVVGRAARVVQALWRGRAGRDRAEAQAVLQWRAAAHTLVASSRLAAAAAERCVEGLARAAGEYVAPLRRPAFVLSKTLSKAQKADALFEAVRPKEAAERLRALAGACGELRRRAAAARALRGGMRNWRRRRGQSADALQTDSLEASLDMNDAPVSSSRLSVRRRQSQGVDSPLSSPPETPSEGWSPSSLRWSQSDWPGVPEGGWSPVRESFQRGALASSESRVPTAQSDSSLEPPRALRVFRDNLPTPSETPGHLSPAQTPRARSPITVPKVAEKAPRAADEKAVDRKKKKVAPIKVAEPRRKRAPSRKGVSPTPSSPAALSPEPKTTATRAPSPVARGRKKEPPKEPPKRRPVDVALPGSAKSGARPGPAGRREPRADELAARARALIQASAGPPKTGPGSPAAARQPAEQPAMAPAPSDAPAPAMAARPPSRLGGTMRALLPALAEDVAAMGSDALRDQSRPGVSVPAARNAKWLRRKTRMLVRDLGVRLRAEGLLAPLSDPGAKALPPLGVDFDGPLEKSTMRAVAAGWAAAAGDRGRRRIKRSPEKAEGPDRLQALLKRLEGAEKTPSCVYAGAHCADGAGELLGLLAVEAGAVARDRALVELLASVAKLEETEPLDPLAGLLGDALGAAPPSSCLCGFIAFSELLDDPRFGRLLVGRPGAGRGPDIASELEYVAPPSQEAFGKLKVVGRGGRGDDAAEVVTFGHVLALLPRLFGCGPEEVSRALRDVAAGHRTATPCTEEEPETPAAEDLGPAPESPRWSLANAVPGSAAGARSWRVEDALPSDKPRVGGRVAPRPPPPPPPPPFRGLRTFLEDVFRLPRLEADEPRACAVAADAFVALCVRYHAKQTERLRAAHVVTLLFEAARAGDFVGGGEARKALGVLRPGLSEARLRAAVDRARGAHETLDFVGFRGLVKATVDDVARKGDARVLGPFLSRSEAPEDLDDLRRLAAAAERVQKRFACYHAASAASARLRDEPPPSPRASMVSLGSDPWGD